MTDETYEESNPPGTELTVQSLPPSPPLKRTPMSKVNNEMKYFHQPPLEQNSLTNNRSFVMLKRNRTSQINVQLKMSLETPFRLTIVCDNQQSTSTDAFRFTFFALE